MNESIGGSALSRRSLVKTAATVAAAGGGLALAGPAGAADAAAEPDRVPASRAPEHRPETGAGVLVRLIDAHLGTLEVYTEGGHHTITDRELAAQLARLGR